MPFPAWDISWVPFQRVFIALTFTEVGIHPGIFSWLLSHTKPPGTQRDYQEDIYFLGPK